MSGGAWSPTVKHEWARNWRLPLAAAAGFSASGLHLYSIGAFVGPLQSEFGWSRAETLGGAALVSFFVALTSMPIGLLIDRFGPRRVGLIGILLMGAGVAGLATASGSVANWLMLWVLVALCAAPVQANVWTSAVASRFEAARGSALAITLCGSSLAAFILPLLASALIGAFGWRGGFVGLGGVWAICVFPILFFLFHGAKDVERLKPVTARIPAPDLPGLTFKQALRTPAYYKLALASGFFALALLGAVVNFVPILTDAGATRMTAAGAASMIGLFSLLGRIVTGALLDRFPAPMVGAISFLLPVPACILLLTGFGGTAGYFAAAALFGATVGAEMDVITYLAARRFGLKNFGAIQGGILAAIALGSATGPLLAGYSSDVLGDYAAFLSGTAVLMVVSALLVGSIRQGAGFSRPTPVN